jgi:putative transposase
MPIRPTTTVDLREKIALMALSGCYTVTEIAELFDVTRPTVYRYRERYRLGGRADLTDRSRAPHVRRRTAAWIEERVITERRRFGFGSKKIRRRMLDEDPEGGWPARSTIDEILRREGLVPGRRRRPRHPSPFSQRVTPTAPGDVHAIDFKGEFRLRRGRWCHPLTMTDAFSRYLLACEALPSIRLELVWPVVERVFREHGLPASVLSDNGPPFGAHGLGRISKFSVRLMELGIRPVFIAPGHPEQNGRHERMHRVLAESAAVRRPTESFRQQQHAFDAFRSFYNDDRPHEGINMDRPVRRHLASPRPFPDVLNPIEYPATFEVRAVHSGMIKWAGTYIFVSDALSTKRLGLELIDDRLWNVYFGSFLVGRLDETERRFI